MCTSTDTGSAQKVAHRSVEVSTASTLAALPGSVMSCLTTALPVFSSVHFSRCTVWIMRSGVGNTGEPTMTTDRTAASNGPINM